AFLGEEGLAQAGLSVHWLAPWEGFGTYEVWGELIRGSSETVFGGAGKLAALAHLNAFYELSPAAYVEVGGLTGRREELGERFGTRVYGLDGTLSWRPPARAKFTGASLRAAYVRSRRDGPAGVTLDADGGFLIGEYQFAQRWHVGARYEWTENPAEPDESSTLLAPTLTWWQSEFVRLRAEYDVLRRPGDDVRQFVLQATFAMGPHRHETY
ncbi:MAG: hypothetical protein ACRELV_07880, partial [Longimicrobiales bacterium]